MKKFYIIFAMALLGSDYLSAQNEACKTVINDGIELLNSKKYAEAKAKFEAAKRLNCDNAQDWIEKCNAAQAAAQSVVPKPPATTDKTEKQIQCEQRYQDGKKEYDKGNYTTALFFFKKGLEEGCNNVNFQQWITACNNNMATPNTTSSVSSTVLDLTEIYRLIFWNMNSSPAQSLSNGKYKGETMSNQRNGLGAYYWSDGSFYFGNWSNNERTGSGMYIVPVGYDISNCPDCGYYSGNFLNGDKSGVGTCYDKTGKLIYYGNFANDKPTDGYPTTGNYSSYKFEVIKYTTDDYYLGETIGGQRGGEGIFFWKDGDMEYNREWKEDGTKAGYGIYVWLNGNTNRR